MKREHLEELQGSHFQPASGSGGKRGWRIVWRPDPKDWRISHHEITGASGNIRRFKSFDSAARQALAWHRSGATVMKRNSYGSAVIERHPA